MKIAATSLCCALAFTIAFTPNVSSAQTATAEADSAASSANDKLPTAEQVFDRCVEEMGGRERLSKIKTATMTGSADIPEFGISGGMKLNYDNGRLSAVVTFNGAETLQGVTDSKGWELSPMTGARILSDAETNQLLSSITLLVYLKPKQIYKSIKNAGIIELDGEKCYRVELLRKGDDAKEELVFSVKSGLPVRETSVRKTPQGEMEVITKISSYKKFDQVMIPTSLSSRLEKLGMTYNVKTTDMKINAPVDDSVFEVPAEIKKLLGN